MSWPISRARANKRGHFAKFGQSELRFLRNLEDNATILEEKEKKKPLFIFFTLSSFYNRKKGEKEERDKGKI